MKTPSSPTFMASTAEKMHAMATGKLAPEQVITNAMSNPIPKELGHTVGTKKQEDPQLTPEASNNLELRVKKLEESVALLQNCAILAVVKKVKKGKK